MSFVHFKYSEMYVHNSKSVRPWQKHEPSYLVTSRKYGWMGLCACMRVCIHACVCVCMHACLCLCVMLLNIHFCQEVHESMSVICQLAVQSNILQDRTRQRACSTSINVETIEAFFLPTTWYQPRVTRDKGHYYCAKEELEQKKCIKSGICCTNYVRCTTWKWPWIQYILHSSTSQLVTTHVFVSDAWEFHQSCQCSVATIQSAVDWAECCVSIDQNMHAKWVWSLQEWHPAKGYRR